jgi:hypothetical protein
LSPAYKQRLVTAGTAFYLWTICHHLNVNALVTSPLAQALSKIGMRLPSLQDSHPALVAAHQIVKKDRHSASTSASLQAAATARLDARLGSMDKPVGYLRSKENPADDPSRNVALRVPNAPSPAPLSETRLAHMNLGAPMERHIHDDEGNLVPPWPTDIHVDLGLAGASTAYDMLHCCNCKQGPVTNKYGILQSLRKCHYCPHRTHFECGSDDTRNTGCACHQKVTPRMNKRQREWRDDIAWPDRAPRQRSDSPRCGLQCQYPVGTEAAPRQVWVACEGSCIYPLGHGPASVCCCFGSQHNPAYFQNSSEALTARRDQVAVGV